jgi:hypothetical protein
MKRDSREELLLNPKPGTAAAAARDFGIDLRLTVECLRLTPEERIRRLDKLIDEARKLQDGETERSQPDPELGSNL